MKIVLTGSASRLARAIIPRLLADSRVTEIRGVDRRPQEFPDRRFVGHCLDIRDGAVRDLLRGADVLMHLAFVVMRGDLGAQRHDRDLMRDINVAASCRLFEDAAAAGVSRIIHCSSASVYRQHEHAFALTEDAERGPVRGFLYAEDKAAVEDWLDRFEKQPGVPEVLRLRPHAVVGPHAHPAIRRMASSRLYLRFPDPQPLLQCVHETDVAQAFAAAVWTKETGAFNLSTDDAQSLKKIAHRRRPAVGLPYAFVERWADRAWRLSLLNTDPSWLPALKRSLVLDNRRARELLHWSPRYPTVEECLEHA